MNRLILVVAMMLCSAAASANIIYNVSRAIGAGSVTGTIETDGTLGTISAVNIVDWTFTLTSADLAGGSPDVITKTGALQTAEVGGFVFATAAALTFDFSGSSPGALLFQGANANYWCLQTDLCFDNDGSAEAIGYGPSGPFSNYAERRVVDTLEVIATAAVVPEPALLSLLALGLAGLGFSLRKRAS